jgi:hypothetical protein
METYYHPKLGLLEVGCLIRDIYGVVEVLEITTDDSCCTCHGKIITRNHIDPFKNVVNRSIHSKNILDISPKPKSKMRWERKS